MQRITGKIHQVDGYRFVPYLPHKRYGKSVSTSVYVVLAVLIRTDVDGSRPSQYRLCRVEPSVPSFLPSQCREHRIKSRMNGHMHGILVSVV